MKTFLIGAILDAIPAFGAVVTCGVLESPIECQNRASTAALNEKAYADGVKAKYEFNDQIAAARAKFWANYPDKPGAEEARTKKQGLRTYQERSQRHLDP
jgi:hypothetical protein